MMNRGRDYEGEDKQESARLSMLGGRGNADMETGSRKQEVQ